MLPAPHAGSAPLAAVRDVPAAVARRFLVLRHHLAPPRALPPGRASVMRVVGRLGSLQFDPIDVAGRNHDLVLLARIAGYRRAWTDALLYESRDLYETYNKMLSLVPSAELPWYRITWDRVGAAHRGGAFDEHAPLVDELLARIRDHGPTSSTDLEPRASIDWYWRPTNPIRAILEALAEAGILGIARREGNRRVYDLVERLFPPELLARRVTEAEQLRHTLLSRYRGNGLLGATGEYSLWAGIGKAPVRARVHAELVAAGAIVPVAVEGFRASRFVVADELAILDAAAAEVAAEGADGPGVAAAHAGAAGGPRHAPRTALDHATPVGRPGGADPGVAFLAPLDPLAWDRDLLVRLWGFDYRWEVYVPAAKRRYGYYVLPLLYGDRLVGRIELRADRAADTLRVLGLWFEAGFEPEADPRFAPALADALHAHRGFSGVRRVALPRAAALRPLARAVREHLGSAMTEIRPITPDELPDWLGTMATAFHETFDPVAVAEAARDLHEPGRTWAAFDERRVVGTLRTWGTELTVPGGACVRAAAVSAVTVLPTHRRRGLLTGMVGSEHAASRERGEPLSLLYASEYPIYGRFGYGAAVRQATWVLDTRDARMLGTPPPGTVTYAEPATARAELEEVYEVHRRRQVGELRRRPVSWEFNLGLRSWPDEKPWRGRLVVRRDAAGTADGYLRYTAKEAWPDGQPRYTAEVNELVTVTDDAYLALWRFLAELDLVATVRAERRHPAEPLPWLYANARSASVAEMWDGLFVCLLDAPAALAARTYAGADALVLEIAGGPWGPDRRGRVRLEAGPDGATCVATDAMPDLTLAASALGAAYLGGGPLRHVVLATGVDEHTPGALARADALFRTVDAPWCTTFF
jgi:uncharacterized protein YcaQ/predicted acetyltransferase